MIVVNYGGGTNSTALLIECVKRGVGVDLVVFADTGSEMPHTYAYLPVVSEWLAGRGLPPIDVVRWVRKDGRFIPLHEWCEEHETVPSRAFGMAGCTSKWKQQPIDKWLRSHHHVHAEHEQGRTVERWIGYDADEPQRADRMVEKNPHPSWWTWHAPLVEWGMGREECVASIVEAGLPLPGKSACWMCPSNRKSEILELKKSHPEHLARALRMERAAIEAGNLGRHTRRGLGGRLNWGEYLRTGEGVEPEEAACGCYDGEPVQIRLPDTRDGGA